MENKQRIQELEKQLSDLIEASIEAMKEKDIFLSTISHELRTPLNAIVGISHLLSQDPHFAGDERIKILRFSSESLLNLFTGLLEMSKIESGKLQLNLSEFHLFDFLFTVSSSAELLAAQKNLQFNFYFDNKIYPMVVGDSVRLSQVLNNLLSNAIKFTEKGRIVLRLDLVKEDFDNQIIRFTVTDTGIGIEEEVQKKIFDYFFQGLRTSALSGVGLGLGITKSLLKLMGSQIKLHSSPGKGSEFSFDLKMAKVILPQQETEPTDEKDLKGFKVLVAEDHKASQFIIKGFLSKWRAHVTLADNGARAVELAQTEKYDLIIMDLHMPIMDGYQATATIRSIGDSHYTQVPIISLTAMTLSEVKDKVMSHGFTDILSKPFQPDQLYTTIKKYLLEKKTTWATSKIENIDFNTLRGYILSFFSTAKLIEEFFEQVSTDLENLKASYGQVISQGNEPLFRKIFSQIHPVLRWLDIKPLHDELLRGKILVSNTELIPSAAVLDNVQKVEYYCEQLVLFFAKEKAALQKRNSNLNSGMFSEGYTWS